MRKNMWAIILQLLADYARFTIAFAWNLRNPFPGRGMARDLSCAHFVKCARRRVVDEQGNTMRMKLHRYSCRFLVQSLFCFALAAFLSMTENLFALEAVGRIIRIDTEKNVLQIDAGGRERLVTIAPDAAVLGNDGKPLTDGLKSKELKEGAEVTIFAEPGGGKTVIRRIRLGNQIGGRRFGEKTRETGTSSVGLKPLTEMTANDRYKGEDGGLYGGGLNDPPPAHLVAARKLTEKITPLDADGKPSKTGKIGLISISMSNATMEYSCFKQIADRDPQKSPSVAIVDCAQGGQAMAEWVDPAARAWSETDRRLKEAGVSPLQVQVVWVKLANKAPRGELAEHGRQMQKDTQSVLQNAKKRFPNLCIAYLGSRIYGGYSGSRLNPEPYAYEGAFAVRWLIQDQLKGAAELQYEDGKGIANAPLLLWGPYFWADGTTPRKSDQLTWERNDLGGDGTHPSQSGREKVAGMLLKFFKEDPLATTWFVKQKDE